jgi:pectinesterase
MVVLKKFVIVVGVLTKLLVALSSHAQTKVFDKVIAKDGTGDYTSVFAAVSMYNNSRKVFFVKNGVYKEKILISAQKTDIRLIGESMEGVIITYDDYAGKSAASSTTAESYTFRVEGDGFYAENITFQNTATQAQAVAMYSRADTIVFKNCRFLGYQDTHYADNGRQYFLNCETYGDVDFIFGNAAVIYDNSILISRSRKAGYITAPSEAVITSVKPGGGTNYHGILIRNSEINAETGLSVASCYLGRPWGPYAASVFLNCNIGDHIKPEGWSVWSTDPINEGYNNHNTAFFAEYHSVDLLENPVDTTQRVPWSRQLTDADTALYYLETYFDGWDPTVKTTALSPPENVTISEDSLRWNAIPGARGYVVLCNDSATGFAVTNAFNISDRPLQEYRVKSVNSFGALSNASEIAVVTKTPAIHTTENDDNVMYISQGILFLPENERVEIYRITGEIEKTLYSSHPINLGDIKPGIYIIRVILNKQGNTITQKIINVSL